MESVFIKNQKLNENKNQWVYYSQKSKRTWNILDIALILSVPFWECRIPSNYKLLQRYHRDSDILVSFKFMIIQVAFTAETTE